MSTTRKIEAVPCQKCGLLPMAIQHNPAYWGWHRYQEPSVTNPLREVATGIAYIVLLVVCAAVLFVVLESFPNAGALRP